MAEAHGGPGRGAVLHAGRSGGFGGHLAAAPIRLRLGVEQETPWNIVRLVPVGDLIGRALAVGPIARRLQSLRLI